MRHRKKTIKLGRTSAHREALLSNQVCSLIAAKRITTTLPKARATRSFAEKMVTLAKQGTLAARRRAVALLRSKDRVAELFQTIGPAFKDRAGGYTRIMKLGRRASDTSEMVLLEWVNYIPQPPRKKKKEEKAVAAPDAAAKATPAKKEMKEKEKKESKV